MIVRDADWTNGARTMTGRALLLLGAGFAIWAVAFVSLYAMLSVGCRFGWHNVELAGSVTLQRAQLAAIFVLSVIASFGLMRATSGPGKASRLQTAAQWAARAATAAVIFVFAPVLALSTCY